ncbi:MAG: ABC transporter ATP-binding protein [Myxococcaceae bacterium]|nr:ABC transporter ATP-binding protein [Myxococcaceae bacterium]
MGTFKKLLNLLSQEERRQGLLLMLLTLWAMVLETLGVGLIIPVLALVSEEKIPKYEFFPMLNQVQMVAGAMLGLVLFYTLKMVFIICLAWKQPKFAYSVGCRLSQTLFEGYLKQPYTFHLQRNSAQLIHHATQGVNIFVHNGLLAGLNLLAEVFVLLGIWLLMMIVEPMGTLIVMLLLGACVSVYHQQTKNRILRWGKQRHYHEGMRIQSLQQGLGGAKDVKLLGRESEFLKQYSYHNFHNSRALSKQSLIGTLPRLWLEWFAVIALAALVLIMLAQRKPISELIPMLGLFAAAAFRLMPSVNRMISNAQSVRYALPVINQISSELSLFSEKSKSEKGECKPINFKREIEVQSLSYCYPQAQNYALKAVSFKIAKGTSVGFVGSSGAGKSTMVDLLLGLLTPTSGQIRVDNCDIQTSLRAWQDLIGYVPQSIYLTDDTLRRNVAFGLADEQIDEVAVLRAIRSAQLDAFVSSLPSGLDTLVGERGIRLSGGQRQRIGIARALYHNPEVLVLDEATSALDVETEQGVMESIQALRSDKTILIVAHRLSTVAHCDELFRFDAGRLVEGTLAAEVLA